MSELITKAERREVLELAKRATPRPWRSHERRPEGRSWSEGGSVRGVDGAYTTPVCRSPMLVVDADFIAAAANAIEGYEAALELAERALEGQRKNNRQAWRLLKDVSHAPRERAMRMLDMHCHEIDAALAQLRGGEEAAGD